MTLLSPIFDTSLKHKWSAPAHESFIPKGLSSKRIEYTSTLQPAQARMSRADYQGPRADFDGIVLEFRCCLGL